VAFANGPGNDNLFTPGFTVHGQCGWGAGDAPYIRLQILEGTYDTRIVPGTDKQGSGLSRHGKGKCMFFPLFRQKTKAVDR